MVEEPRIHPPPPPTTPRLAPWDAVQELCNKLDRLIAVLEGVAPPAPPPEWPGWEPLISKLDEIKSQLAELKITAVTTWEAREPEEIYRESIRTIGIFHSELVNWTKGKRLILKVESTLNQAVQIQPIGNIKNSIDKSVDINSALPCTANGNISVGLAWDDWLPYIGAKITVSTAPASGELKIEAVIQE
ncbi:hypothetical protein ES703_42998 [subsurface metagenome]